MVNFAFADEFYIGGNISSKMVLSICFQLLCEIDYAGEEELWLSGRVTVWDEKVPGPIPSILG